uniref:C2 domain-containing protein n=1 Tax=Loa loa TaxID=7209 RepID=A0A1I7VPS2_LOALO
MTISCARRSYGEKLQLYNVSKSHSWKTKEANADPSWGSCFQLHLNFDESQNSNSGKSRNTATSLEILHNRGNSDLTIIRTSSIFGQKLASVSNEHSRIEVNI